MLSATNMNHDEVWVAAAHDDSSDPATGLVVAWLDEDRVAVVWGEAADQYRGHVGPVPAEARVEFMDELTPRPGRLTPDTSAAPRPVVGGLPWAPGPGVLHTGSGGSTYYPATSV